MVKMWGMSSISSDFNPHIEGIMKGISFTKEKKFNNPLDDKYWTKAMFYQTEADPGFDLDPSKIKAFSIPMAGAGFSLRPTGDKIETWNPGPGHYMEWIWTESPSYSFSRELKFSDIWKDLQSAKINVWRINMGK